MRVRTEARPSSMNRSGRSALGPDRAKSPHQELLNGGVIQNPQLLLKRRGRRHVLAQERELTSSR